MNHLHLVYKSAILLAAASQIVLASAKDTWEENWIREGKPDGDTPLTLSVALQQGGVERLKESVLRAQAPLSRDEILGLLTPPANSTAIFRDWLGDQKTWETLSWSPSGDWTSWNTTVEAAELLLGTTYSVFRHKSLNTTLIRAPSYHIPDSLRGHVKLVHPTTHFTTLSQDELQVLPSEERQKRQDVAVACASKTGPACLATLYSFKREIGDFSAPGNAIGVVGFHDDYTNIADVREWTIANMPEVIEARGAAFRTYTVNGGLIPSVPHLKLSKVDIGLQYAIGLTWPIPATFYLVGGSSSTGGAPLLEWVNAAITTLALPPVLVLNYAEVEDSIPREYAERVCDGLATLAARGVSIIVPSGDHGSSDCPVTAASTSALFPATCPFVTVVGGTTLDSDGSERGAKFSGGGSSRYFSRPSYQVNINSDSLPTPGRAYPDISFVASDYEVFVGGNSNKVSTTAGSATSFASMIATINDLLLEGGKKPLGLLNTWIYEGKAKSAFTDITVGTSTGCGTVQGFEAGVGWDAVTGLGTPNYERLVKAAGF